MKQVLLTGLAAALSVTVISKLSPSEASQDVTPVDESGSHSQLKQSTATKPAQPNLHPTKTQESSVLSSNVVKVGEVQPASAAQTDAASAMATVQVYYQNGRQAATIYVRNIPVVTMLGAEAHANRSPGVKVATVDPDLGALATASKKDINDPVWRATTVVGKLNQLVASGLKAEDIKVVWNEKRKSYIVRTADQHLLEITQHDTVLPKSTRNTAQDALQITNRLRYQLGYASPLKEIEGLPKPVAKKSNVVAVGPIRFQIKGWASWYGPGFDGAYTASGERFNQYDLTAAHRSLPFGTRVRVTNLDNGRSVVVRITDRGPFVGGRVLDLSRGAAQILGTVGTGVSPIRMDVLQ